VSRGRPDCWKRPVGWPEGQDALSCPRMAPQRRGGHRDGATASTHSRQELGTLGPRREVIDGDAVRAVGTGHMSGCDVYDRRFGRRRAPCRRACRRASCLHQGVPACCRGPAAAPHTSRAGARRAVSSAGAGMIRPDVRSRPAGSCGLQRLRVVQGLTTSSCLAPCEACPSEQTIRTVRTSLLTALRLPERARGNKKAPAVDIPRALANDREMQTETNKTITPLRHVGRGRSGDGSSLV
jgi:hypothetical protein